LPVLSEEDLDDFDQLESNEESGDKGLDDEGKKKKKKKERKHKKDKKDKKRKEKRHRKSKPADELPNLESEIQEEGNAVQSGEEKPEIGQKRKRKFVRNADIEAKPG
jgi:hypothetical protein